MLELDSVLEKAEETKIMNFDPTSFDIHRVYDDDFCNESAVFLHKELQNIRKRLQGDISQEEHDRLISLYVQVIIALKEVSGYVYLLK